MEPKVNHTTIETAHVDISDSASNPAPSHAKIVQRARPVTTDEPDQAPACEELE